MTIDNNVYCSMIHGGLQLHFTNSKVYANHCCLRQDHFEVTHNTNLWESKEFGSLRKLNLNNKWDKDCEQICRGLENSSNFSFRTGMNNGLKLTGSDISGPARIDLMFDRSCNLACRTCRPGLSTYWEKHLRENKLWDSRYIIDNQNPDVISVLSKLDLSNLRMFVFCGGETLLGKEYWKIAEWLANNVPNAKQNLTVSFQTNGTQTINPKHYQIIDKFFLVKLYISLDGVEQQFNYLRWPADWQNVVNNIQDLKQKLPSNVMFLIEETLSIFNLATSYKLEQWVKENFSTNREGDIVDHTKHIAKGTFGLHALSQEYVDAIAKTNYSHLIPRNFQENLNSIKIAVQEIEKFDAIRNESFKNVFPEVADYYAKYLRSV